MRSAKVEIIVSNAPRKFIGWYVGLGVVKLGVWLMGFRNYRTKASL